MSEIWIEDPNWRELFISFSIRVTENFFLTHLAPPPPPHSARALLRKYKAKLTMQGVLRIRTVGKWVTLEFPT